MISVDEAYRLIVSHKKDFGTEKIYFQEALKRVLSAPVLADRDFPPYDRVMMDGIAINSESFVKGTQHFFIEKIVAAGSPLSFLDGSENCVEVMTGAVLPLNADAVVPYEQCEVRDNVAMVNIDDIKRYQNIHRQAMDEKKDAILIEKNTCLSPVHISVLATVGMTEPEVYKVPSIAICSTGDELVDVAQTPLPHQVRQSNGHLLMADLKDSAINASLHHLPDHLPQMKQQLDAIIQHHDVLLLSGAVSKGKFDYLPQALEELGMTTIFHGVAQRPGKPFLFGVIDKKPVFAFPGNPVSTFVCYHLYFKRWLHECLRQTRQTLSAKLSCDINFLLPLALHALVKLEYRKGECLAQPISTSTSGDIPSLLHTDGIISLSAQKNKFEKGEVVEVILCR